MQSEKKLDEIGGITKPLDKEQLKHNENLAALKSDEFKLRQLKRRKVINDLEYDVLGPNYELLLFEDLKVQTMAKSKMFQKNEFEKGKEIWDDKLFSRMT